MSSSLGHTTANNDGVSINSTSCQDNKLPKSDDVLHYLHYGQDKISYEIIRKDKARKLRIKVHSDQHVVVTVPMQVTDEFIHNSVKKRVCWKWQHLQDFANQKSDVLPRRYVSGETQFYLGRRYVLKVIIHPEQVAGLKLVRGKLMVNLTHDSSDRAAKVKSLLDGWYQTKAKTIFAERFAAVLPQANWVNSSPTFKIRSKNNGAAAQLKAT